MNRHDAQPVQQIFAQCSLCYALLRDPVGRRDEAHVDDGILLLAADTPNDAILNHAQQLGLNRQRHLCQLVEEQRPAVRDLEQARLVAVGAGERAFAMAEQLAIRAALPATRRS